MAARESSSNPVSSLPEQVPAAIEVEMLASIPPKSRGLVKRAFRGVASPRMAIKAHCLVCVGFGRAAVRGCEVYRCPLHAYRPYRGGR